MFDVDRIIAVMTLLASFYGVWYTRKTNTFRIHIDNPIISSQNFNPYLLSFEVLNDSPKAIYLESISISGDGLELLPDHEFIEYGDSMYYEDDEQSPFTESTLLPANNSVEFRYYIKEPVKEITVTLTTNTYIRCFSKTISFTVIPHYCE